MHMPRRRHTERGNTLCPKISNLRGREGEGVAETFLFFIHSQRYTHRLNLLDVADESLLHFILWASALR